MKHIYKEEIDIEKSLQETEDSLGVVDIEKARKSLRGQPGTTGEDTGSTSVIEKSLPIEKMKRHQRVSSKR